MNGEPSPDHTTLTMTMTFFWALRLKLSLKFLLTEAPTIICLILNSISGAKPDQKITRSFYQGASLFKAGFITIRKQSLLRKTIRDYVSTK